MLGKNWNKKCQVSLKALRWFARNLEDGPMDRRSFPVSVNEFFFGECKTYECNVELCVLKWGKNNDPNTGNYSSELSKAIGKMKHKTSIKTPQKEWINIFNERPRLQPMTWHMLVWKKVHMISQQGKKSWQESFDFNIITGEGGINRCWAMILLLFHIGHCVLQKYMFGLQVSMWFGMGLHCEEVVLDKICRNAESLFRGKSFFTALYNFICLYVHLCSHIQ